MNAAAGDTPRSLGVRGEAGVRQAVVAGRSGGSTNSMSRPKRGGCSSASAMSCGRRAASRSTSSCSCNDRPWRACQAGLRSNGVRLWRPNRMPTPRAVVCGRTHAAERVLLLGEPDDLAEELGPAVRLDQPEGHRATGAAGHLAHPGHLGPGAGQVLAVALAETGRRLEDAPPVPAEHVGEGEELVRRGPRAGDRTAVGDGVEQRPRRREPERAGVHGLVDELRHRRDVVLGGGRVVQAALAHGVLAHRAVADHPADVRCPWAGARSSPGTRRR